MATSTIYNKQQIIEMVKEKKSSDRICQTKTCKKSEMDELFTNIC